MADILARRDGRKMRDIAQLSKPSEPQISRTVPVKQDGFSTIINCRWCGEKSTEAYIPEFKDGENGKPVEIILNYEPCDKCKKVWADMVILIEVTDVELYKDCLPITTVNNTPLFPTGRHVGVTEAAAQECIDKNAKKGMVFFMEKEMFEDIFKAQFKT